MIDLHALTHFLDSTLDNDAYQQPDIATNGLQVEAGKAINTIAFAVDACMDSIESAVAKKADLLIVHHGLFWGKSPHLAVSVHGKRLAALMHNNLSLYASHLPLDGHSQLGNAAQLAQFLGCDNYQPAVHCSPHSAPVGVIAETPSDWTTNTVMERLSALPHFTSYPVLDFGAKSFSKLAIATGSASSLIAELASLGVDTLISGEPKHEAFHLAKELQINAIFAGHYATERLGLQALAQELESQFEVSTVWIEHPTGL